MKHRKTISLISMVAGVLLAVGVASPASAAGTPWSAQYGAGSGVGTYAVTDIGFPFVDWIFDGTITSASNECYLVRVTAFSLLAAGSVAATADSPTQCGPGSTAFTLTVFGRVQDHLTVRVCRTTADCGPPTRPR